MLEVEGVFIQGVLREFYKVLGFDSMQEIGAKLVELGANEKFADKFMNGENGKRNSHRAPTVMIGLRFLHDRKDVLLEHLRATKHRATAAYLLNLFSLYHEGAERMPILHEIFLHWANQETQIGTTLKSGVYQIFRRFKPRMTTAPEKDYAGNDPDNALIIELLYLDAERRECLIISSEYNAYWGTVHLNDDRMLAMILQRPVEGHLTEVRHRFVAIHGKHDSGHGIPEIFSSLYMKSGDLTKRPLAGEAILKLLPKGMHEAVYSRIEQIFSGPYRAIQLREDADIAPYIATFHSVRGGGTADATLDEVPFIKRLTEPDADGVVLLREPLRTTDAHSLESVSTDAEIELAPYFRTEKTTAEPAGSD